MQLRQDDAERVERVCAALRDAPGIPDHMKAVYARTILSHCRDCPAPITKPKRFNLFRRGKKP
jgi:hypothetical protein